MSVDETSGSDAAPARIRERAAALGPYLSDRLGRTADIAEVSLASEGMSASTLLVDLHHGERIVLRAQERVDDQLLSLDGAAQFHLLRDVVAHGVPAPPALFFEPDPDILGLPFLATAGLPGAAVVPWSSAGREFLARAGRGPAGAQLLDILVGVHSVPVDGENVVRAVGLPSSDSGRATLKRLRSAVEGNVVQAEPILTDALGWLDANLPPCPEPTLVHGDFRAGNLLFEGERISGLLDWEFAQVGDPARDLAWFMAKSNRQSDDLACDMVPVAEFVADYRRAGGGDISPSSIAYWDVFMLVYSTAMWLRSTALWRAGRLDDLRIARWTHALPKLRVMILDALDEAGR
ncbi:phosphotransferase family protein [Pseudonocardia endophytica]|uniref:Aminoglycoside phosphotransferase (APT) family kinase protein n=1 Tax=Pseudonocardia endophytica TaxID=401976 RepID=A0A4R1HSJ2_PSEEN|nr:phosphotransferase family protein [Pseudonocardia endophytica]TCK22819.1 aminoglycoside phosphotransferase (APT) family kinase protein [Pseudonocardia endophytica]